jgi:hypothetical protein
MQESEGKMVIFLMDPPVKAHKRCQSNRLWMEWARCQKYFAQWLRRSAKLFSGLSVQCIFFNGVYEKTHQSVEVMTLPQIVPLNVRNPTTRATTTGQIECKIQAAAEI